MKHVIYGLKDENGVIFYIGQTNNIYVRIRAHLYEVENGNHLPKYNKLRRCIKNGLVIDNLYCVLEENIESENVDAREMYYIAEHRKKNPKLKNLTAVGKGAIGFGQELHDRITKKKIGRKRSEESKKRMSEARMGMRFSEEHKKNLSIARRKRITKPETLEKMRTSMRNRFIGKTKKYVLIDPNGIEHDVSHLGDFCRDNNLAHANLRAVVNGRRPHYKGWTVKNA